MVNPAVAMAQVGHSTAFYALTEFRVKGTEANCSGTENLVIPLTF